MSRRPAGQENSRDQAWLVALAPGYDHAGVEPVVVEAAAPDGMVVVDGSATDLVLVRLDDVRGRLVEGGADVNAPRVLLGPISAKGAWRRGPLRREVVVDGWRVEVELEPARLAILRARAQRREDETTHAGPTEVRAIIPGRVVSVQVNPGDDVVAGQQILVIEAMKMQNELRAPRSGRVERVAVGPGKTIELGELLLVIG
jgi:biotin carboxyl carrier protein